MKRKEEGSNLIRNTNTIQGSEVSQPEPETKNTQQAGRGMAVVRGWIEHSPSKILGSFIDSVLFPLLAPQM